MMFGINRNLTLKVFAASAYQDPIRPLVTKKFSGDMLASRQLARMILAMTPLQKDPVDFLVPIPLHWTRYSSRGFNQAYEMAKFLSKQLNVPVLNLIRRSKRTTFQWKLAPNERQLNVRGAFDFSWWYRLTGTDFLRDKHIVLVDDLCTTGSTLVHIAKVIAKAHPASITAVVGCRAI